jgi:hypothetical protein
MTSPVWRKSSRSNAQGGDCVELAALPGAIGIRDSKNPAGPILEVNRAQLAELVNRIKLEEI